MFSHTRSVLEEGVLSFDSIDKDVRSLTYFHHFFVDLIHKFRILLNLLACTLELFFKSVAAFDLCRLSVFGLGGETGRRWNSSLRVGKSRTSSNGNRSWQGNCS